MEKLFNIGDVVEVSEDGITDSSDMEFLTQYIGQKLTIVDETLIHDYELWHYTCKDENQDIVMFKENIPFGFIDADLKRAESKNKTIQEIIQNHVLGEIFSEFPTDLDTNTFDFFLRADVDCTEDVSMSPLGTEWGFEVCEAYELDNIRAIRGLMQYMYNDLDGLKSTLFQHASHTIQINKDEIESESAFYDIAQYPNATLHRQGTQDEYITFITVSTEALS